MTVLRIGLVTEGPTDQIVIRTLLTSYFRETSRRSEITFVDLQPTLDQTSGSKEGGWRMVYAWCLRNTPQHRIGFYFGSGLFAGDMDTSRCDLIVVHLDSDIAQDIGGKATKVQEPSDSANIKERGRFIEAVILEWLWPDGTEADTLHIPAPAVEAVEAWLIAALGDIRSAEAIRNPAKTLLELEYSRSGRIPPPEAKRIRKNTARYRNISERAATNVLTVVNHCEWFKALIARIEPHLI